MSCVFSLRTSNLFLFTDLQQLFNENDKDQSGFLSLSELKKSLEAAGFSFTGEGYGSIIKRFDVNGPSRV